MRNGLRLPVTPKPIETGRVDHMSKPTGWQDKPEKPKLAGGRSGPLFSSEWTVWALGKYKAEFRVVNHAAAPDKKPFDLSEALEQAMKY